MQNTSFRSSSENYSMNSPGKKPNKSKQHRSIFDAPKPVEPQRIKRIKNRRNMVKNYRDNIRNIYHQTDFLINWHDEGLSCFIKPVEKSSCCSFMGRSVMSDSTTSKSNFKDPTLQYDSNYTFSQSQDTNEASNLVDITTQTLPKSKKISPNQEELNESQEQTQTDINESTFDENAQNTDYNLPEENDEQVQEEEENYEQYLEENDEQIQEEEEENDEQIQEEESQHENSGQDQFNEDIAENDSKEGTGANFSSEQYSNIMNDFIKQDESQTNNLQDMTIEQPINYPGISAIDPQSNDQEEEEVTEIHSYQLKYVQQDGCRSFEDDEIVDADANEQQQENSAASKAVNAQTVLIGVENLPIDEDAETFAALQYYTKDKRPIGRQKIIDLNDNDDDVPIFQFSIFNQSDIIEILVFLKDDVNNPTLVSGIQLPVSSVDWNCNETQFFDLISADDLRNGISVSKGNAGNIALIFELI